MTRLRIALLAVLGGLAMLAAPNVGLAQQQFYGGRSDSPYGPTTSPYLNLLQNNNPLNQVSSYNTLVRPLVDQGNAINRQGASLNRLQQQANSGVGAGGSRSGGTTGHGSHFMYYSHFYGMHR
jgi:hypothetical protein